MSEKTNPPNGEPVESQPNGSESNAAEEHKVGPGRPPTDKRWKKGGPSPNPRGRPRKDQSMAPDARKAFEQALNKKVPVSRGDKEVLMTRVEIGLEQFLNQFAKGDRYARRDLMEYAKKLDIDFLAKYKQTLEQALTPNYQTILDAFLARRSGAANVAPAEPVLAPPELLDDDPAENDSAEPEPTLRSPPLAKTEPQPIPEPSRKEKQAVQKLDQASLGYGSPPPGGVSLTTGKWT
jgi:hypothetical protein